ncbi:carbohydrate ABC transporter permease [Poriferisphaera sp. WC338]|uniref:carbohydrate ABC transporter permease n=1 Tax=Poriferisphaera sp. WC338 TaxID=3425129 RepID=UPI003D8191E2
MKRSSFHSRLSPYLFLSPFIAVFLLFTAYPMLHSVVLAFQQTDGPDVSVFVGLKNFQWIFTDPDFWKACKNTAFFSFGSVVVQIPAALGLAILLNRKDIAARSIWRMIFFSPSLVGMAFVAILASIIFEKNTGMLNVTLNQMIGFNLEFPWMEQFVMASLIIAAFWMSVGFSMVYFLAALQNVSKELTEAAMVDGAGPWSRFSHVTLPAIRQVCAFVILISLVGSFQIFELSYLLLGGGAGPNNQGLTIVMYLYMKGFDQGDLGMASAVGWILASTLFVFAIIQKRVSG